MCDLFERESLTVQVKVRKEPLGEKVEAQPARGREEHQTHAIP